MLPTPYYQDQDVTLYHADCRDILPDLAAVDVVITDPPYSEHVHRSVRSRRMDPSRDRGGRGGADIRCRVDLGFEHLTPELRRAVSIEAGRLARRWVVVFSDVEGAGTWRDDLTRAGLEYVRTGAWIKLGCTPQFSGDRPASGFETVTITHQPGRKRWNGGGRHAIWSHPIVLDRSHRGRRNHPAEKPEGLLAELVDQFSDPGDLILDPFAGSGTTAVAAARLGRRCIAIEDQERHCATIVRRLAQSPLRFPLPVPTDAHVLQAALIPMEGNPA